MFEKQTKKDVSEGQEKILKDIIERETNLASRLNQLHEITVNVKENLVSIKNTSEGYEAKIEQISAFQDIIDNKLIEMHINSVEIEQKIQSKILDLNIEFEQRMNKIDEKIQSMESKAPKSSKKVINCECGKQFPAENEDHYRNHVLDKHSSLKNRKCYICHVKIPDLSHMDGHIRKHHKKAVNFKQK